MHIIPNLIKLDVHSMDLELADGIGNGHGCMELDSVNLNSMRKIILFKNKNGLDLTSELLMTYPKTSYS